MSCSPGAVAQLWAEINYGGTTRRVLLKRIRSGTTHLSAEPVDFISMELEPLRIDPREQGSRHLRNNSLVSEFHVGIDLIEGEGSFSIYVKKAVFHVCVSGLSIRTSIMGPEETIHFYERAMRSATTPNE